MRGRSGALRRWYGNRGRLARRAFVAVVVGAVLLTGGTVASVVWIRDAADGHIYSEALNGVTTGAAPTRALAAVRHCRAR
ncbi:hypothetical protein FBZ33_3531 [Micromonospora sp. A202]|uniref:hypothetical protein n=1 Tax=Micromonospora sp. A202 TaxID=2572899 RepID=UPI0011522A12|nr:hypothetical protein [Micromonospora sp. A202]TQJ23265.1 hypothetical protein FBZ33_3531 [Micromonospora sp. A202]